MVWWQSALIFVWTLFKDWLYLFAAPFTKPTMLWITVPIVLNWVFTEIYQEKKGTSLGNAISNGTIILWVGIDWARITVESLPSKINWAFLITKIFICFLLFLYGVYVIVAGIKTKSRIRIMGKIRVITYFMLMLSPIFYDVVPLTWQYLLSIIVFFPLFYLVVEILDRITPDPQVYASDNGKTDIGDGATSFGGDLNSGMGGMGNDNFGEDLGKDFGSLSNQGNDFSSPGRSKGNAGNFDFGMNKGRKF